MVTIVLILLVAVIGVGIWGYEKYKEQSFIAASIDGNAPSPNFITEESQTVIDALKEPKKLKLERYSNCIVLPDGQKISYMTDTLVNFQKFSKLSFEPTRKEWEILRGIVKKLYSHI
jgi:hypothetical protein